jgi:hypothetical protein
MATSAPNEVDVLVFTMSCQGVSCSPLVGRAIRGDIQEAEEE